MHIPFIALPPLFHGDAIVVSLPAFGDYKVDVVFVGEFHHYFIDFGDGEDKLFG